MARDVAVIRQIDGGDYSVKSSASLSSSTSSALPFRLDDYAGLATYRGKQIFNQEQIINQIDSGYQISGKTITFSFLDGPHTTGADLRWNRSAC